MSGCQHADWILGFCVVTEGGKPLPGPAGKDGPANASGLHVAGARVADRGHLVRRRAQGYREPSCHRSGTRWSRAANCFDPVSGGRCQPGPLYQAVLQLIPLFHSAFAVGCSRGRARCTRRTRQYRATAAAGRRADAGFRNIPIRTRPHRS